ncbi:murein L,D-transpeptidase catalytic domain family protein [Pontibacter sp. SGAir0037]|uniref:murein L,D-transpeptidase catalytic domain family protein n=1 Tax=Pontibacter sp. SGAir0037 TaxID=2571030 RepID=UPI0010CD5E04|nr:murein L,D-transpeptidase catalytic domain family protein [Pontibacter sp. SGAir0037]QCR21671.1 hypothetical protein C1N53_04470 [Pontibacter sp. SGAir0037]
MLRIALTSFTLCLISFMSPGAVTVSESPVVAVEKVAESSDPAAATALTYEQKLLAFDEHIGALYDEAALKKYGLSQEVFRNALVGFQNFKQKGLLGADKSILTVIDFTKSSRVKRLWVIDLSARKVLHHTLVAHGRNSGEDKALNFSNAANSYMSSMGFYLTDKTYYGKHGLSLRLSGMDAAFNSNAMSRAIVMHGADYVSEAFVKQYGRLGRSLGCPAIPQELTKQIVETVKDKTCLYIHTADKKYSSTYLDQTLAVESFAAEMPLLAVTK